MNALREIVRLPDVRRIESAWALALTGYAIVTVAILVYCYNVGGPGLVAIYGVLQTVPAALVTPLVTGLADRIRGDRLLRWTTGAQAILVAIAAFMAATNGPAAIVITFGAMAASLAGAYRPLQAAALPWLVQTPSQLMAANAGATLMESAAGLVGPVLAGMMLLHFDVPATIGVAAAFLALAWLGLLALTMPEDSRRAGARGPRQVVRDFANGMRIFGRIAPPAGTAVLTFGQTFVRGALQVLLVVVAIEVLALGEDAVGWFNAALGVGGLLGALAAAALLRVTRLGRAFVAGVMLWGLPLILLWALPTPVSAFIALALVGVGNAVEDAGMFTLLPRLAGPGAAGAVLGALEFVAAFAIGAGALAAPVLNDWLGATASLGLLGAVLTLLALAYAARFIKIDRAMPEPGPELALLRGFPMFAPLPLVVAEDLTSRLQTRHYTDEQVVLREGDPGDEFHIVASGAASVSVAGVARPALHEGDGFGEIALLHDVPRTATVVARGALKTLALLRSDFLAALSRDYASSAAASALAERRLTADRVAAADQDTADGGASPEL